jgi:hypothetical protein
MGRDYFHVNEHSITAQYAAMNHTQCLAERERLGEAFMDDVGLGDALEDCAQLEQLAIETRTRIRILENVMRENENTRQVRQNQASERPDARISLRAKFAAMTPEERANELVRAQEALDEYDLAELSSETSFEDPLLRQHRITLEETVRILSHNAEGGPN